MTKKLLAILLAVVMVITAAFGGMTVSAEGVTNYITDGSFDSPATSVTYADATTHKLNPINSSALNNLWGGGTNSGVVYMEVMNENGNNYAAARFKGSDGAGGYYVRPLAQMVALEPSTEYTLSFTARKTYNCSIEMLAGVLAGDDIYKSAETAKVSKAKDKLTIDSFSWKNYTLKFTTDATNTNYAIIFGNNDRTVSDATIGYDLDNVVLFKSSEGVFVDANATVGGTVTGGGVVPNGETVTLTATAKSGYTFTGWSDDAADATRTVTATADVSLTANFTKNAADFVPNGDFESDDWVLSDYWTTLSGNAGFTEATDPTNPNNTVAYAKGGTAATTMLSKNTITLEDGHTYYIRFDSYIANEVSGSGTNFYRVGFLKTGAADLGGANFYNKNFSIYETTSNNKFVGEWYTGYGISYTHSGDTVEAHIVLGMYNNQCTSDWYIDNIIAYDAEDVCNDFSVTAKRGGVVEGAKQYYFAGEELTLTAVPKAGFEFAGWSDGETNATRTVTVESGANYVAQFTYDGGVNLAINGDFEDETLSVADAWGVVVSGDKVFQKGTDENGNNYAYTIPSQRNAIATEAFTIKPGEKYVIEFDYYFVNTDSGDANDFYRYGFIEASQPDLKGDSFTALSGNDYGRYSPHGQNDNWFGVWHHEIKSYTNTGDTDVQVKAVIGYYNNECKYEWRVDNIKVYNTANALAIKATAENGTATWKHENNHTVNTYVIPGDKVTLTATPEKEGYEFLGWFVNDTLVSESEVYTATVNESTTFTAKYKFPPVYSVVNGDFEATDNIDFTTNITGTATEGVWAKVGTGVNMFTRCEATDADPDFVGNAYAVATVPEAGYVRTFGQFVTLKPNTDYTLEFAAKGNVLTSGDKPYSPVFGAVIKRVSGSHGIHPSGNNVNVINSSSFTNILGDGEWHRYTVTFNSGDNTEVVVAFGGNHTDTSMVGMYFAVDNVVLSESKTSNISDFENGADGWTASEGATVTTGTTADFNLSSFGKYLGNTVGVITPAAEDDTFTSPAFDTVVGERYDVVIYIRRYSDESKGAFSFTAGGTDESMKAAAYGKPVNDSELGIYENNDGFKLVPDNTNKDNYQSGTLVKLIFTFTATNNTHNITLTALNTQGALVDGFILYAHSDTVELAQNSISFKGTAIRTTGVQGLRFKSSMNFDALKNFGNYAKVVEYGTLAIMEDNKKEDEAITVENLTDGTYDYKKSSGTIGCRLKRGVAYNAADGTDVEFASDIYAKDFTAVLIGIAEENYAKNYVTRVYAKVQFADGSFTYVYGDEQIASVSGVAQHIVDYNLENEEIREYLNTNILSK